MSAPDLSQPGPWQQLFAHAMRLMSHLESQVANPGWTFGGRTL